LVATDEPILEVGITAADSQEILAISSVTGNNYKKMVYGSILMVI
jgi:hypothetical protein